jgi:hypothetical protein
MGSHPRACARLPSSGRSWPTASQACTFGGAPSSSPARTAARTRLPQLPGQGPYACLSRHDRPARPGESPPAPGARSSALVRREDAHGESLDVVVQTSFLDCPELDCAAARPPDRLAGGAPGRTPPVEAPRCAIILPPVGRGDGVGPHHPAAPQGGWTASPLARLAGTALAPLSRHAVMARPGGPGLRRDAARRAPARLRHRRVGPPKLKATWPRSAGLPGVSL